MNETQEVASTMLSGYVNSLNGNKPTFDNAREYIKVHYENNMPGGWRGWLSYQMLDNMAESLYHSAKA